MMTALESLKESTARGGGVSSLVEEDGIEALSSGQGTVDHRRWRGQQRMPAAFMDRGLAESADRPGPRLTVCHFPPGTSKWNKIEHRMFSHITMNWSGKPLVSHEVIVQWIGKTTTAAGWKVRAALDPRPYPPDEKTSRTELESVP